MRTRPLFATAVFLVVGSFVAGCGGGSSSLPGIPVAPSSVSVVAPLAGSGSTATFPSLQGYDTIVTVPPASGASGSLTLTESIGLPDGLTQASERRVASVFADGTTPLLYVTLVSPVTVTLAGIPAFTVVSARPFSAAAYGVAFYDPATGWRLIATLTAAGNRLTFSGTSAPISLVANTRYAIEIASLPSASPSPSPTASPVPSATPSPSASPTTAPTATPKPTATPTVAPTATPTAAPTATPTVAPTVTPAPTATPTIAPTATPLPTPTPTPLPALSFSAAALQFNALGQTQQVTLVSGPGTCCATYTTATSDANVATIVQVGNGTWNVSSVNPGTATVTLTTPGYQPYTIAVSVAQVILVPQSRGGHR